MINDFLTFIFVKIVLNNNATRCSVGCCIYHSFCQRSQRQLLQVAGVAVAVVAYFVAIIAVAIMEIGCSRHYIRG